MTKSSYGLVLLFAGWGVGAEAQQVAGPRLVTADEAMKHYHATFGVSADRRCPEPGRGTDEEIVVCGSTGQRRRLPLPIERDPGEAVRHINEAGSGTAALAGPACSHSCYQPVTVNPIAIILAAPKVIRHILHPGDD